jgi:Tfp pilus assembly protein PilN
MIRVNLLKSDTKTVEKKGPVAPDEPKAEKLPKSNIINLIIVLVIIVLGSLAFLQRKALNTEKNLLAAAQEEQRILTPVLQKLELMEQRKVYLEKKIGLIQELRSRQSIPLQILDTLTRGLPDWVWLINASLHDRALVITGRAQSNLQISEYANALQKSGIFSIVTVVNTQQKSIATNVIVEFTINATILPPSATPAIEPKKGPEA